MILEGSRLDISYLIGALIFLGVALIIWADAIQNSSRKK